MTAVLISLAFNLVLIGFVVALWREQRKSEREAQRQAALWNGERRQLLDRIMYLSGQPWSPPPVEYHEEEPVDLADLPYYPEQTALTEA